MRCFNKCVLLALMVSSPAAVLAQDTIPKRDSLRAAGSMVDPSDSARKLAKITVKATRPAVGYSARRSFSATRSDIPLIDVPQAVTILARQLMADQAMQGMADVVRYVPGVTMGQGEGHRDAPTIRGNSTTADFFLDGIRDDAQYLRDIYNVEQVEVLKGANAMMFGRGGGGGVINRVSKEPLWTPVASLALEGGSFEHKRATADYGTSAGHAWAGRVNGVVERSNHFRDATVVEREGVNPTMTLVLGSTLVRAGYEYFADRRTVNRGLPSFAGRPSRADITTFFGDPSQSPSRTSLNSGTVSVEHGWMNGLTFRNRSRLGGYDKFYQNVYPGPVSSDGSQVDLLAYNSTIGRTNFFNQSDLTLTAATGPWKHDLLVGGDYGFQATTNYRNTGYFADGSTAFKAPFESPTVQVPVTFRQSATDADNRTNLNVAAVFVQDRIVFSSRWQAIVGARYERFALEFLNHRNKQRLWREDRVLSPRAGLVFKPLGGLSTYGTYSMSYLPASGDQFGSLNANTQTLKPEVFVNREAGLKWDIREDLNVTGAVYRLVRSNTAAPDPANPARLVQTGEQRSTGVELGFAGKLAERWQIAGGVSSQRAIIMSATSAAKAGASVPLVPRTSASLWNRVQLTRRVGAGVGAVHQADMFAAIDDKVTLPGFTRLDAAGYVSITANAKAQLNLENVLDRRYYATSHGNNNIMPGAPRTLRVSLTATR